MAKRNRECTLDVPPGPDFLKALEARFAESLPQALVRGSTALQQLKHVLDLSSEEWAVLRQGLLAYYFLFVETILELNGSPLVRDGDIAELQLLALTHWRNVDALFDSDALQLSSHRHRELATAASALMRGRAKDLGIEWDASPGQEYLAFYHGSEPKSLGPAPSGGEIVEAFLEEQFVKEPCGRMSFLHFVPQHAVRAVPLEMVWYKFYVSVVSLDDDLDDVLADAIAQRETPVVRFLNRLGAFRPGKAGAFHRHLLFLYDYLLRQFDLCIELALRDHRTAALLALRTLREAAERKLEESRWTQNP